MSIVGQFSSIMWEPKYLANLFELDWEHSQLLSVVKDLDLAKFDCSVSGGSMVRTLMKTDIFKGDIDIFPHSEQCLKELMDRFQAVKGFKKAIHAYEFPYEKGIRKTKAQIITRHKPIMDLDATLKTFDLEHCKLGYFPKTNTIVSSIAAPVMITQRKVRLAHINEPKYSLARVLKYKKMGFEADDAIEQLVAMEIKGLKNHNFDNFEPAEVWKEIVRAVSSS